MKLTASQVRIVAAAALVFAIVFGLRQSQALFIGAINTSTGLGIAAISLAFAVAQLVWGLTQPVAGALSDRFGTARVLVAGGLLVALGTALTPYVHSQWALVLAIGVIAAGGAGLAGLGVLMSAVGRAVPPAARGMASAMVNAGGSFGQFAVVPVAQWLTGAIGWVGTLTGLSAMALAVLPLAAILRTRPGAAEAPGAAAPPEKPLGDAHDVPRLRDRDGAHLPGDRAADGRPGRAHARHALPGDALRHRHAGPPGRRLLRRVDRRAHLRGDAELRLDVLPGRAAGHRRRAHPPADSRTRAGGPGHPAGLKGDNRALLKKEPDWPDPLPGPTK